MREDGQNIRVFNSVWSDSKQQWSGGEINAVVEDPSKDEGYLKVANGDYKILATDYIGYTVVYSCRDLAKHLSNEYVWILARDPTTPLSDA